MADKAKSFLQLKKIPHKRVAVRALSSSQYKRELIVQDTP